MSDPGLRPRVVIIGAGFGGLACARSLAGQPVDVLVIDRHNYHLFTPLLYQVASSLLNPSDIAFPVRAVFRRSKNVRVMLGEVARVDFARREVAVLATSDDGGRPAEVAGPEERVPYDYLVLATGSTTNFFGMTAVAHVAHGLKDLPEALALRNRVLLCFEAAARERDPGARQPWLTFVVVGAGPTGVEYAGALSELVRLVLVKDFPELDMRRVRVVLVEGRDQVLPAFPKPLAEDARLRLLRRGIEVRLGARLAGVDGDRITLSDGEQLRAKTLVWAAGVQPSGLVRALGLPTTPSGRVSVDDFLRVVGHDRVFAIGDLAAVPYRGGEMPMLSAPAMQEGRSVARTILASLSARPPQAFRYVDKGIMATIGRHAAVAQLGRFRFKGFIGWVMWLVVHLYFIIGFRNRIVVLIEWAWDYFRYDRPIRSITKSK